MVFAVNSTDLSFANSSSIFLCVLAIPSSQTSSAPVNGPVAADADVDGAADVVVFASGLAVDVVVPLQPATGRARITVAVRLARRRLTVIRSAYKMRFVRIWY